MTDWTHVIDNALLGTRDTAPPDGEFAGHSPEGALLKQLAILGVQRRAGFVPAKVKHAPADSPAPPEILPPCSMQAMEWLHTFTANSYYSSLVLHWFTLIADRRKRVPHAELSYVLSLITTHAEWAVYILSVIGERGKWMIERSDGFKKLKESDEWAAFLEGKRLTLELPVISDQDAYLVQQREQMLKDLQHE